MDLILWLELITFVVLMMLSGFFSSSETAFFSLSTVQLEQMRRDENPRLSLVKRMLSEPRRLIVTILIGNEFVNVAASVISAAIVIDLMGAENKYLNLFIMIPILLLVGEITPKTLALRHNVPFASFQSRWITLFAKLIFPLRWAVRLIADAITSILIGKQRTRGNIVTQDMMRTLAREAEEEGVLDDHEARFIDQIFDFGNKTVADIMTPRSAIYYLSADLSLSEIIAELSRTPRATRIPIYKDNRDNVIGILYARDLLRLDLKSVSTQELAVHDYLRKPFLIPEVKPATELFETFRERNLSFALTIDEFGGVTGLVTMEDMYEHIFGDIRTLSSAATMQGMKKLEDGRFAIDGEMNITEFNREMGTNITGEHALTIAGLVLNTYGELPPKDALVDIDGLRFIVAKVDHYRITQLLFEQRTDTEQIQDEDQAEPDELQTEIQKKQMQRTATSPNEPVTTEQEKK